MHNIFLPLSCSTPKRTTPRPRRVHRFAIDSPITPEGQVQHFHAPSHRFMTPIDEIDRCHLHDLAKTSRSTATPSAFHQSLVLSLFSWLPANRPISRRPPAWSRTFATAWSSSPRCYDLVCSFLCVGISQISCVVGLGVCLFIIALRSSSRRSADRSSPRIPSLEQ